MNIAVVTPAYKTPRPWLDQCLASVRSQSVPCTHFLVSDGDHSLKAADFRGVEFIQLPKPHEDVGNAARAIGSVSAVVRGFDAIAYLDADNSYEADHLSRLVELQARTGAAVCTAARNLVDLDGQLLGRCPEVDGENFVDTSCLFFTRGAFGIISVWYLMPRNLGAGGDRVVWHAVKSEGISRAHSCVPTVNFRTNYQAHYLYFGKIPPPGAKHVHIETICDGHFVAARTSVHETNFPLASASTTTIVSQSTLAMCPADPISLVEYRMERPRVSLCMIAKNEEHNLPSCLGSVRDLFDETIVVDTGSTDRTREIAQSMGAKVFDFTWIDDFAAARNESLRHATGDWIFWLDGDERLDEPNLAKLRKLVTELPNENLAYMMCQKSAPDQLTGAAIIVDQARLFRKLPQASWHYRCHEQILLSLMEQGAREVRTDIAIRHAGYEDSELRRRKRQRNMRLLHLDLDEHPQDAFILFNLASAYLEEGRAEHAVSLLQRCLQLAPAGASYLPKAYRHLAGGLHSLGRDAEALRYCRYGKDQFPQEVGLWFHEGVLLMAGGDMVSARHAFETILKLPAQPNYAGIDANLAGCRTRHNLAFIYRRLGLMSKAEAQWKTTLVESPEFEPAWLALLELYLETNRGLEAEALLTRLDGKAYKYAIAPALEARLTLSRGNVSGALQILEESLKRNPRAVWQRVFLADMMLRVAGDDQGAEKHLRVILSQTPNEPQSRKKLAEIQTRRRASKR